MSNLPSSQGRAGSPSRPDCPPSDLGRARSPSAPKDGRLGEASLPYRHKLPHNTPAWADSGSVFFITICCEQRGAKILTQPDIAKGLAQSASYRMHLAHWWIHLLLLMPDHLHALLSFPPAPGMRRVVADWKRFTSGRLGIEWQRDFFDHRLRRDESFEEKAHYIRMNPVRGGLVSQVEDWPWVWAATDFQNSDCVPLNNG